MNRWIRLCVDADDLGQVLGISAELHDDAKRIELAEFGRKPDETLLDALARCRRCAEALWAVQLELWP